MGLCIYIYWLRIVIEGAPPPRPLYLLLLPQGQFRTCLAWLATSPQNKLGVETILDMLTTLGYDKEALIQRANDMNMRGQPGPYPQSLSSSDAAAE